MLLMPWMLYRYMLSEVVRVFLLTATVLVTVIAFGVTVRNLAGEHQLAAFDTLKYLTLAMVPMMQFALPFSAGFASTMVFHRLTSENEILAAAVSGISYRRILLPLVALGLGLALIMVGLTQYAIPRFWTYMERTIATDVTKLFQMQIDRGVPFEAGNIRIYADDMRVIANPQDTEAETRMILFRVAAVELDGDGRIETDVTAQRAVVDIYREEGQTLIMLAMQETMQFDGGTGQLAYLPLIEPPRPLIMPHLFRDHLRAMTRGQLLRLRNDPDRFGPVRELRDDLVIELTDREVWRTLQTELAERGRIYLSQRDIGRRHYEIEGNGIRHGVITVEDRRPVVVTQFDGSLPLRRITAERVTLSRMAASGLGSAAFSIELLNCEIVDLQSPETINRRERLTDTNLVLRDVAIEDLPALSSEQVLRRARSIDDLGPSVVDAVERLKHRIEDLRMEVRARIFMRYAQSTTALLLLLLGATLAMVLRGSLPLVIYLWAFVPSILCLILISGGDKMMRDGQIVAGVSVMWSGNTVLLLMLLALLARLMRN
jgi:lipopolysaccharide export system permease protein